MPTSTVGIQYDSGNFNCKNSYHLKFNTAECNLYIQHNPSQSVNIILLRPRKEKVKIHMQTQETLKRQSNLKVQKQGQKHHNTRFQDIPQGSHDQNNNLVLTPKQTSRTIKRNRNTRTYTTQLSLTNLG